MVRKRLSKGYECTLNLARGFLRFFDTLSRIPMVRYLVFSFGAFLVFLRKVYSA